MGLDPVTQMYIVQAIVTAASVGYQVKQAEKMKKKMDAAAEARKGQKFTVSGTSAPLPVVYGKQRLGGIHCSYKVSSSYPSVTENADEVLATEFGSGAQSGSKNEFLAVQTALCHGGIESVKHILVNEIDYRGYTKEMKENKSSFNHRFLIHKDGGTADASATAFGFPNTNKFTGCAYVNNFFKLNRDEPQYSGIPSMAYIVKGRKVRAITRSGSSPNYTYSLNSSYTYSNNPALCLLDYLLNNDFGRGLTANDVDLESFYNAADICNTPVLTGATIGGEVNDVKPIFSYTSQNDFPTTDIEPYMAGYLYYDETNDTLYTQTQSGSAPNITASYTLTTAPATDTIPLYECNITLSTEETIRNNIERILNTMGLSDLVWTPQGKYKLILSYPQTQAQQDALVTHTFDEDSIVRESVKLVFPKAQDRFNQVTVSFDNEFENFKDDTFTWPPTNSSVHQTYLSEDNNQPLTTSLQGDGVTSKYHAQALAEQQVRKSRALYTLNFSVNKEGLTVEPGDLIKVSMPTMSITNELYRVESIKVNTDFSVEISAYKFDFSVLAWNVPNDLDYVVKPDFDFKVGVPTSLTFSNTSDITGTSSGKLSWTAADDASVVEYIIEAKVGSNSYKTLGTSVTNSFDITGLKTGTYTFSVRSRNITGLKSERVELANQGLNLITVGSVAVIYADSANAASNSQSYTFSANKPFVAYYVYNSDLPTLPITSGITFTRFIGIDSKAISVGATSQTFTFNSQGTATPSNQSITLTAALQNTTDTDATFATSPSVTLTGTGNTRTLTSANFGTNDSVTITVTADSSVSDSITIYRLQDAVSGTSINVQYSADDSTYTDTIPSGVKYIRYGTKADGATSFTYSAGVKYVPEEGIEYTVEDGDNAYLHIKYSNDNGTTFTSNSGEDVGTYIGTYSDNTAADSTTISDYTWVQIEGSGGLTAILSNESHTVPAPNTGNPSTSELTGSGTLISVFEGTTQLDYDGTGTTNGHFTVTAAATGCTAGAISDSTNNASVADLSAMTSDTASITFTITGKTLLGESFTITKTQSFSLSRLGDTGSTGASTNIVFQRSATALTTAPTDSDITANGPWYDNADDATGTGLLYAANGTKAVGATSFTWSDPFRVEGEAVAEIVIYRLNSNAGHAPASSPTYDFTNDTLTHPTTGWQRSAPALASNGDIVYRSSGVASGSALETAAEVTFGTPVIYAQRTDGATGTPAKSVQITADSQVFTFDKNLDNSNNAIPVPSSQTITFTAKLQNTTGNVTFTAVDENGTNVISNLTGSGNTRSLTAANFGNAEKYIVTATADSISDSITIHKLKEGSDAITVVLSNETHVLPCHPSGVGKVDGTGHYPNSGTLIQVYEGANALTAVGVFPGLSNGKFLLEDRTNTSIQNNISYTSSGTAITIPDLKEIEARATSASVEYEIAIQTSTGVRVTKFITQKFTKAIEDKVPQYSPIRFDHYKSGGVASYTGTYGTSTWGFDTSLGPSSNGQYTAFMGTGTVVWNQPASTVTSVGTNVGFINSSGQSITDGSGDPVYQTNSLLLMLPSEEPNLNDYYHSITTLKVGNQVAVKKDGITVVFDVTYAEYSSFSYDARVAQYMGIIRVSYNSTQSSAGAETLNWPNLNDNNPLDIVLHHELKGNSGTDGTAVTINGAQILIDTNPKNNNDADYIKGSRYTGADKSGTWGGPAAPYNVYNFTGTTTAPTDPADDQTFTAVSYNENLTDAFLEANPQLTSMTDIPIKSKIWARFQQTNANGVDNSENYSYRTWNPTTLIWSNHSEEIGDINTPFFAHDLISDEAFLTKVQANVINVDRIQINKSVELEDGGAWRVGKNGPDDDGNNGIFFGNPSASGNINHDFAIASSGNVGTSSAHGVKFTETETKLQNPTILIGDPGNLLGDYENTGTSSYTSSHIALGSYNSLTGIGSKSVTVTMVGSGGGGAGAETPSGSAGAGQTSTYTIYNNGQAMTTANGYSKNYTGSALGGAAGSGYGVAVTDGDRGDASSFSLGGAGGGAYGTGGVGSKGSGGGGGGGRDANAWTKPKKGGAGGGAGTTITNFHDLTNYSGPFTIQYTLPAGGAGQGSNRGHGGRGGGGYISYNVITDSLKEITLGDPIGVNQNWSNINMVQNTWYQNTSGRSIQIHLSQGVAGGGHSRLEIYEGSGTPPVTTSTQALSGGGNQSTATDVTVVGYKTDDDQWSSVSTPIVPNGAYYRQTNHGNYFAAKLS